MDERTPNDRQAGLNPRDALDILDIRTAAQGGATELARRTDAGPDVLHYLATHAAPATRAAVAAKLRRRPSPTGSWRMTTMKTCAPNWRSRSRA